MDQMHYGFRVGSVGLIIAPDTASEVVASRPTYALPSTDRWFRGLINLRGALVPVYDLHLLLGLDTESDNDAIILVLDEGERAVAMITDGMPVALDSAGLRPAEQPPTLPAPLADHVTTAFEDGDDVWTTFEHRKFFESLRNRLAV